MIALLRVSTSESMIPRTCFRILNRCLFTMLLHVCSLPVSPQIVITAHIHPSTCVLLSLRRTSAPIHLTSVLAVLGTQETSCILIAGLLERNIFDLCLPEFDKPWVIHLRETCYCSTNLCTWMPYTVYKNRSVRRHQEFPRILRFLLWRVVFPEFAQGRS